MTYWKIEIYGPKKTYAITEISALDTNMEDLTDEEIVWNRVYDAEDDGYFSLECGHHSYRIDEAEYEKMRKKGVLCI